jgi:hypothetical protein
MKRFLATLALTCVLSGSAFAGTIPTCGLTSEEPTTEATEPGHIPTSDSTSPGEMPGVDVSILLTLLDLAF